MNALRTRRAALLILAAAGAIAWGICASWDQSPNESGHLRPGMSPRSDGTQSSEITTVAAITDTKTVREVAPSVDPTPQQAPPSHSPTPDERRDFRMLLNYAHQCGLDLPSRLDGPDSMWLALSATALTYHNAMQDQRAKYDKRLFEIGSKAVADPASPLELVSSGADRPSAAYSRPKYAGEHVVMVGKNGASYALRLPPGTDAELDGDLADMNQTRSRAVEDCVRILRMYGQMQ